MVIGSRKVSKVSLIKPVPLHTLHTRMCSHCGPWEGFMLCIKNYEAAVFIIIFNIYIIITLNEEREREMTLLYF